MPPVLPPRDGQLQLIGTSKEGEEYHDQLARDLTASLQQDRAKEGKKRNEEERLSSINKDIITSHNLDHGYVHDITAIYVHGKQSTYSL